MNGKRIAMELRLRRMPVSTGWHVRPVLSSDREALSALLYGAFRGTVDDDGETFADASAEIGKTFAGAYGRLLPECYFVAPDRVLCEVHRRFEALSIRIGFPRQDLRIGQFADETDPADTGDEAAEVPPHQP